jgi:hypothetical protein
MWQKHVTIIILRSTIEQLGAYHEAHETSMVLTLQAVDDASKKHWWRKITERQRQRMSLKLQPSNPATAAFYLLLLQTFANLTH